MNNDVNKWLKEDHEYCVNLTKEIAQDFYDAVVPLTPVRTGHLRDGWKIETSETGSSVSNDVDYLQYVNDGTKYIKPKRFIEVAWQQTLDKIK